MLFVGTTLYVRRFTSIGGGSRLLLAGPFLREVLPDLCTTTSVIDFIQVGGIHVLVGLLIPVLGVLVGCRPAHVHHQRGGGLKRAPRSKRDPCCDVPGVVSGISDTTPWGTRSQSESFVDLSRH